MRPPTHRWLIPFALLALIAAGCSQGPGATAGGGATAAAATTGAGPSAGALPSGPSAGGGGSKPACELLTDEDIKEITGLVVASKIDDPADTVYQNVCRWTFAEFGEMDLGVLDVDATGFLERTVQIEGGTEIAGLADRAVRTETTGSILALSGDTLLDLFTVGTGTSDEVEEALVARALANLRS